MTLFLETSAPAYHLGTELGEPLSMPEDDATLVRALFAYWLSPPTLVGHAGVAWPPNRSGLQHEVAYELRLAESSRPEAAMHDPIDEWLFDPAEVAGYEAVLRGILGAAEALDNRNPRETRQPS